MYFNNINEPNTYDAIVVGSGISGGWAAKELCEKGMKTLVLERGRDFQHVTDYKTAYLAPWEFPHLKRSTRQMRREQSVQMRTGYTVSEAHGYLFVKDTEHPYIEHKRFDWMRGYQKGGRSITWGKQSYRLSPMDFEANAKEGIGTPWPVSYDDIAPWYSYAERFAGISGSKEGLPQLPDGDFQPPMALNAVELEAKKAIETKWKGRKLIIGRAAHLTEPTEEQINLGRGQCQYRNLCMRGCPFGAYFSSQAATLPAAARTGNMTLRPHSIVHSIILDDDKGRAKGVRVIDENTGQAIEFFARVIFLCASALPSTAILMRSTSKRNPNGMDESGALGHYLMDHHLGVGANGVFEGHLDKTTFGRRPNGIYIPRYRNLHEPGTGGYLRGFGYQGGASRQGWSRNIEGFGVEFKKQFTSFGAWEMGMGGFGECLPYYENKVELSKTRTDRWGLPLLEFDAEFKDNEKKMRIDMMNDAAEMLEAAGMKDISTHNSEPVIGLGIHEMGTARMGTSSKNSVLNKWNQVWGTPNVFCTDGAFMTSAGCQNPSLTYMAFTARAANYAVEELKKGNL
ncbi:MAG: Fructose dehydrogenase large subunit [Saprospiraceae bacterium]|nr:Fructose dehydrogenase large subunit [Saprospiraceae bacterium]